MKNKFVLTEEESKRILSLHKEKIKEERGQLSEQEEDLDEDDKGQSTGRIMAGSGTGAAIGAGLGAWAFGIGAIPGAFIGAGVGALVGWMTTGGGYYDKVQGTLKWCDAHRGKIGPTVNDDTRIRDIADDISGAVEGFGRTDEVMIAKSLRKLKSIPDLCRLNDIYRRRNNESLLNAIDGDIDQDGEWRDFVWRPIEDLYDYSQKKTKDTEKVKKAAEKCGWGTDVDGYAKSGWRCPKDKNVTPGPSPIPPSPIPPGPIPGPGPRPGKRYYFDYQDAINALNKKGCPTGGGGEEDKEEDTFADDWRATTNKPVDTTVTTDNFSSWAK